MATRAQQAEQRRLIAESIKVGHTMEAVGAHFNVSPSHIRAACNSHGVEIPRQRKLVTYRTLNILAGLIRGESPQTLANQANVTTAWVYLLAKNARAAGIPGVPEFRSGAQ